MCGIFTGPNPTEDSGPSAYKVATTPAPKICKVSMDDLDLGKFECLSSAALLHVFKNLSLEQTLVMLY